MRVIKKINHNAVLVDDQGTEKIIVGKGVGFSATPNQPFRVVGVEKVFTLDSREKVRLFSEMVNQIPRHYVEFCEELIHYVTDQLDQPLDTNIYIALTDHVYFAVQRRADDSNVAAIMLPGMKLLYPDEFRVAETVVERINARYQTRLGENEVGFVTMHIVNAELGERDSTNSLKIIEVTQAVLDYLVRHGDQQLDQQSFLYNRLMIHVRFLVQRLIYGEDVQFNGSSVFSTDFRSSRECQLAGELATMLDQRFGLTVNESEQLYLAMHLMRISHIRA